MNKILNKIKNVKVRKKLTIGEMLKRSAYNTRKRQIKCKHNLSLLDIREDAKYFIYILYCSKCGFIHIFHFNKDRDYLKEKEIVKNDNKSNV